MLSEDVVTSVDVVDVDLTDLTSLASVVGFFVVHFFFCVCALLPALEGVFGVIEVEYLGRWGQGGPAAGAWFRSVPAFPPALQLAYD